MAKPRRSSDHGSGVGGGSGGIIRSRGSGGGGAFSVSQNNATGASGQFAKLQEGVLKGYDSKQQQKLAAKRIAELEAEAQAHGYKVSSGTNPSGGVAAATGNTNTSSPPLSAGSTARRPPSATISPFFANFDVESYAHPTLKRNDDDDSPVVEGGAGGDEKGKSGSKWMMTAAWGTLMVGDDGLSISRTSSLPVDDADFSASFTAEEVKRAQAMLSLAARPTHASVQRNLTPRPPPEKQRHTHVRQGSMW